MDPARLPDFRQQIAIAKLIGTQHRPYRRSERFAILTR
jgi:hypothetical protein